MTRDNIFLGTCALRHRTTPELGDSVRPVGIFEDGGLVKE